MVVFSILVAVIDELLYIDVYCVTIMVLMSWFGTLADFVDGVTSGNLSILVVAVETVQVLVRVLPPLLSSSVVLSVHICTLHSRMCGGDTGVCILVPFSMVSDLGV